METTFEIKVSEEDIDHLGHVNYHNYITFSEKAMGDWYKKAGVTRADFIEKNLGTVVVKLDVSYIQEARLGEVLKIITTPVRLGNKSFVIKQDIFNQNGDHLTEVNKIFVMFDTSIRKGVVVIDKIARQFQNADKK